MKKTLFTLFFSGLMLCGYSQEKMAFGGEYTFNPNKVSCVTEAQRLVILEKIQQNKQLLLSAGTLQPKSTAEAPSFIWPVRQAEGFAYNDVWCISNYVDHSDSGQVVDYNCGNRSYDGHMGIDIFTWPFSWMQMDLGQANAVAAEAGTILFKDDGHFDQSCAMEGGDWNAVYILHDDGSVALYGHLKSGSLTTKTLGDTVEKGEFLGKVGSSGNSTGPHLHFEVYDADNNLIDPFAGGCNGLNSESWWQQDLEYTQPNINAVLTHSAPVDFNDCPDIETTNITDQFSPGDMVLAAIYMRDQEPDSTINLRVRRPDSSYLYNWNFTFETYYNASYWYWTIEPDAVGDWTWEAEYNGHTVSHVFHVGTSDVKENNLAAVSVYPNPTSGELRFEGGSPIVEVSVTDMMGKKILIEKGDVIITTDLSPFAKGMYFVTFSSQDKKSRTIKIIRD